MSALNFPLRYRSSGKTWRWLRKRLQIWRSCGPTSPETSVRLPRRLITVSRALELKFTEEEVSAAC